MGGLPCHVVPCNRLTHSGSWAVGHCTTTGEGGGKVVGAPGFGSPAPAPHPPAPRGPGHSPHCAHLLTCVCVCIRCLCGTAPPPTHTHTHCPQDEFYSSAKCAAQGCGAFLQQVSPREKWCGTCRKTVNRDDNAQQNLVAVFEAWLDGSPRPDHLQRPRAAAPAGPRRTA
jgi:hypothetical protein